MKNLATALAASTLGLVLVTSPSAVATSSDAVVIVSPGDSSVVDYAAAQVVDLSSASADLSVSLTCAAADYAESQAVTMQGEVSVSFPALPHPATCQVTVADASGQTRATTSYRASGAFDLVPTTTTSHPVGWTGPLVVESTGVAPVTTPSVQVTCDGGYDRTVSFEIGATGQRTDVAIPAVGTVGTCRVLAHHMTLGTFRIVQPVTVKVGKVDPRFYPTIQDGFRDTVEVPLTASRDLDVVLAITDSRGEVVAGTTATLAAKARTEFVWDGSVAAEAGGNKPGPVGEYLLQVLDTAGEGASAVLVSQPLEIATGWRKRQVNRWIDVDEVRFRGAGACDHGQYYSYEHYMLCAGSPKTSWMEAYGVFRTPQGMQRPRFAALANTCPIDEPPGEAYEAHRQLRPGVFEVFVRISGHRCAEVSGFKATYTQRYRI